MALNFEQKQQLVSDIAGRLPDFQAGAIAEYRGLSVADMTELRRRARESGVVVQVMKNTLARRAMANSDFACLSPYLAGPVVFSASADPVAMAKVLRGFAKEHEAFVVTAGVMNGAPIEAAALDRLAKLPGREELLATLCATLAAPMQKLAATLNEIPTKFVRGLSAVQADKANAAD